MRMSLDTNILVYAEGLNDAARKGAAVKLLRRLPPGNVHLPENAKLMTGQDLLGHFVVLHAQGENRFALRLRDEGIKIINVQGK